jgi:hypothetical protein
MRHVSADVKEANIRLIKNQRNRIISLKVASFTKVETSH